MSSKIPKLYISVDLTRRINSLGFYSYVLPCAKIIHLEGGL